MNTKKGITLLIAVVFTTASLAIVLGISAIFFGELRIGQSAQGSYAAYYYANTGVECAMYYDLYPPDAEDLIDEYFDPDDITYPKSITCGGKTTSIPSPSVDSNGNDVFHFGFSDDDLCIPDVEVKKTLAGGAVFDSIAKNSCGGAPRVVERGIRSFFPDET